MVAKQCCCFQKKKKSSGSASMTNYKKLLEFRLCMFHNNCQNTSRDIMGNYQMPDWQSTANAPLTLFLIQTEEALSCKMTMATTCSKCIQRDCTFQPLPVLVGSIILLLTHFCGTSLAMRLPSLLRRTIYHSCHWHKKHHTHKHTCYMISFL